MLSKKIGVVLFGLVAFTNVLKAQLKVGERAPDVNISDWIGNVPEKKDLKGKILVIDFWATWCAPCLEGMPHMNELVQRYKDKENLLFLALTDEKKNVVESLIKRVSISSVIVTDESIRTLKSFKINRIPTCVIINDENRIVWTGYSSALSEEVIDKVLKGEDPLSVSPDTKYTPMERSKITDSLTKIYGAYFKDDQIKEYFAFGPLTAEKPVMRLATQKKIIVIGSGLKDQFSQFLDVGKNQIFLPEKLSNVLISYIYKTVEDRDEEELMKRILQRLNLRVRTTDSAMNVMQLQIADKELFNKYALTKSNVSRSSSSASYSAISNASFTELKRPIESAFNTVVMTKDAANFKKKLYMTVKIDNLEDLKSSLKTYGIEVEFVVKKLPVYKFEYVIR